MIRLDELVPLHIEDPEQSIVAPVCLPWKDSDKEIIKELEENADTLLAGWGKVTNLGIKRSITDRTLRREKLKIVESSKCRSGNDKNEIRAMSCRYREHYYSNTKVWVFWGTIFT